MRICPKCSAYYADDSSTFCLIDGMPLMNVDPSSDNWSEGSRVIEEKENALRKQQRKLKWRRVLMSTMLIATIVVCAASINRWTYVEKVGPERTPSPTPSPTPTPSPSPVVYKITGQVTEAGKPLPLVKIMLDGGRIPSTTTDAQGKYTFVGLPAGMSYIVTPDPTIKFTEPSRTINLTRDGTADFAVQLYKITGQVTEAGKPLGGIDIKLGGGRILSTTTGPDGKYTFSGLRAGRPYTITPTKAKMKFTLPSDTVKKLTKDEVVDFSRDAPPRECTDADKNREEKAIIDRFKTGWERLIKGDPPKISAYGLAVGQEVTLGRSIEYQVTFDKECTGAVVTATYVWEVPGPGGRTSVRGEKKFTCDKPRRAWRCP